MTMFVSVTIALFGILLALFYKSSRSSKSPPGPWGFPILGHLPLMGENPAKTLLKWRSIYGPIISVRFGTLNTVVFNDVKTIKEAFNMSSLSGRKDISYFPEATDRKGIIYGEGTPNMEQRRFVLKAMKDFGFRSGHVDMESIIQTEISDLLNTFKVMSKKPLRVYQAFNLSMVNVVWLCLTGKRFEHGDPNLPELAGICSRILGIPTGFQLLAFFVPWLGKIMPNLSGYNNGLKEFQHMTKFMESHITELKSTRIKNQPRNVADAYLDKVDSTTDKDSSFFPSKNVLPFIMGDLFLGGIDTTSTLLEWTFAYLAIHQNVQRKLQKEISDVTGNTRVTCLADRPLMPYTDAVIHEVLRRAPLVTFNLGKQAMEDTVFHGYMIRKGTMLYANFYGLFNDQDVWGDPENFRPERFIDESGNFVKPEAMIPFGFGKRFCVGESLAKDQSFLYVTSLFQKFNVSCVPGKEVNLKAKFSFVIHPDEANEVMLTERY